MRSLLPQNAASARRGVRKTRDLRNVALRNAILRKAGVHDHTRRAPPLRELPCSRAL